MGFAGKNRKMGAVQLTEECTVLFFHERDAHAIGSTADVLGIVRVVLFGVVVDIEVLLRLIEPPSWLDVD